MQLVHFFLLILVCIIYFTTKQLSCLHKLSLMVDHEQLQAYVLCKEGRGLEFIDTLLDDESSTYKLTRCIQVALLCVEEKWTHRPSMVEVAAMLRNENQNLPMPRRPAFSTNEYDEENKNKINGNVHSINIVTISQLLPR
ncbi:putative non-specific serine/threonine protein kinase [Helianthus annuus]|nr:putative non-specific serine/threonine protein kinase [Helianthus annuus]